MTAEQQIEAVSKKLVELNPGFDGKLTAADGKDTPKIENGLVTELRFFTTKVTDISPVRALTQLQILNCAGAQSGVIGALIDLSPLQGMQLTFMGCDHTQVTDLSPLMECTKLKYLHISNTKVTAEEVAAFKKALPNCKVKWDDSAKPATPVPAPSGTK